MLMTLSVNVTYTPVVIIPNPSNAFSPMVQELDENTRSNTPVHPENARAPMDVTVEGMVTDLVRGQRLIRRGFPLTYVTATDAYWQLVTNRNARLTQLRHLDDGRQVALFAGGLDRIFCDHVPLQVEKPGFGAHPAKVDPCIVLLHIIYLFIDSLS